MLTRTDIKNIQKMIDETFEEKFEEKFEEVYVRFHNEVMNFKDAILHELQDMRIEMTLLVHKVSNHSDVLENHDVRISKLEKGNKTATQ